MIRPVPPMFSYFGAKHRIAGLYPEPQTGRIIEPFAGSAAYACRYPSRDVLLLEINPKVAGVWEYLIRTPASEIRALPLLGPEEGVDALGNVPQEARWLVGFWLAKGTGGPYVNPSAWRRERADDPKYQGQFWSGRIRERIAHQVGRIRHWKVRCANYWEAPDVQADWFIDPPYQGIAGYGYRRFGSRWIDYGTLGDWCVERKGQVIVCEEQGKTWLPFRPFRTAHGLNGHKRTGVSREAIWHRPLYEQHTLALESA